MNYSSIKNCDIANGTGVRTSLFVSGCTHHCEGCFNPETWDFNHGKIFDKAAEDSIIRETTPSYIAGLTLLGGEPLEPANQRALVGFLRRFKETLPEKNIWCYTGYTFEEDILNENGRAHCEVTNELLSMIDIIVDGEFVLSKKDITLKFRGSSNQRIIDVKTGEILSESVYATNQRAGA